MTVIMILAVLAVFVTLGAVSDLPPLYGTNPPAFDHFDEQAEEISPNVERERVVNTWTGNFSIY
jgi:hypothetical protein